MAEKLAIYLIQLLEKFTCADKIYTRSLLLKSWCIAFITLFYIIFSSPAALSNSWLKHEKPCLNLMLKEGCS